jgi:DnaJ-class molecular chaperone
LVDKLKETEFHAEFIRSHEISIQGIQLDKSNLSHRYGAFGCSRWKQVAHQLDFDHDPMYVEFVIENGRNTIIMSGSGFDDDMEDEFDKEMEQLSKDIELGRIAEGDAEKKRLGALKKYMMKVKNWLLTSKVKAGERITDITSSAAFSQSRDGARDATTMDSMSFTVKNAVGEKEEKPMTCPSCNGKRYVTEEIVCEKCDGVGTITSRSSITGFDGRPLPSRTRKCGGCRGKGNVGKRVKCKECKGKGKIVP